MKSKLRYLLTSLYLGLIGAAAMVGPAFAGCYGELSAGGGLTNNELSSSFSGKTDLSQTGLLGGIGLGCDTAMPQANGMAIGGIVRYSRMALIGDIGTGASLKSDTLWETALKITVKLHERYEAYGLGGWSWTNLDFPSGFGIGNKNPNGLLLGGGLNALVRDSGWRAGLEYTWHDLQKQHLDSSESITPNLHVIRFTLTRPFWTEAAAPLK